MPTNSGQSKGTNAATIVVTVLALISIVLRFTTRLITKAGLAADDWWILIAFILTIVTGGCLLYGSHSDPNGGETVDRDSPTFDYAPHVTYLKMSFVVATLYFSVVTSAKISILLMYRRVFAVDSFRFHSLIVGAVVLIWWLVGTIAVIVSCIPIDRLWVGPSAGGYCFDFGVFWMSIGSVELVIDTAILVLPISVVVNLWMSKQQKILVSGIFLLGSFVIVTGIVRVVLGYKPGSQNADFTRAELWSAVHVGTAIICACLPTLRPLLTRANKSVSDISSRYRGSSATGHSNPQNAQVTGSGSRHTEIYGLDNYKRENDFDYQHSETRGLNQESSEVIAAT